MLIKIKHCFSICQCGCGILELMRDWSWRKKILVGLGLFVLILGFYVLFFPFLLPVRNEYCYFESYEHIGAFACDYDWNLVWYDGILQLDL